MTLREYFMLTRRVGFGLKQETKLLTYQLLATLVEGVGIAMFVPIVQIVANRDAPVAPANSPLSRMMDWVYDLIGGQPSLIVMVTLAYLAIVVRQVFGYQRLVAIGEIRETLTFNIRCQVFRRYLRADSAYHDREATGSIVNSMTSELGLAVYACMAPVQLLGYFLIFLFYLGMLFVIGGTTAFLALAVLGGVLLMTRRLLNRSSKSGTNVAEANKRLANFLIERLGSIRLIRLSGAEEAEMADLRGLAGKQRDGMLKVWLLNARLGSIVEPIAVGFGLLMIYLGSTVIGLQIEQLAAIGIVAAMRLLPISRELMVSSQAVMANNASLRSLVDRLGTMQQAAEIRSGRLPFTGLKSALRFDAVEFTYPAGGKRPALHDISLTIPAGSMTALVGPSGAGKSTLIDLIPRLREPSQGRIFLDDTALAEFDVEALREGIAYMSQSPLVFNVSIREHIRYGRPSATDADVEAAAALAGVADFLNDLPHGYNTLVGEEGARLSGGQRQRLDLARALIRRAAILILDEPTSNLDARSEARFKQALQQIRRETGATILVVAHRLSTIEDADQIVVLSAGRIEGSGRHEELLRNNDWYARAYREQSREEPRAGENVEARSFAK